MPETIAHREDVGLVQLFNILSLIARVIQGIGAIPGEMSSYPGGYYYLEQDDDQTGVFYVLKIKGVRIDQGEPFAPSLTALNAIFQPPPNGFGLRL